MLTQAYNEQNVEHNFVRLRDLPEGGKREAVTDYSPPQEVVEGPKYRKEHESLEEEFTLASAMIDARSRAGLTHKELAARMQTSQSAIARVESGRTVPSGHALQRFARATGTRLRISFEPARSSRRVGPR